MYVTRSMDTVLHAFHGLHYSIYEQYDCIRHPTILLSLSEYFYGYINFTKDLYTQITVELPKTGPSENLKSPETGQ